MRWIVGVDVRPRTEAAIRTAAWMAARSRGVTARPMRFIGVHVVPRMPRVSERDDVVDEAVARAQERADDLVRSLAVGDALDRVEAVPGTSAEASLAAAAEYYDADGIVIGRASPTETTSIVRLGSVARRLVRSLPRAVMVVPPDHDARRTEGPVLLATDLKHDATGAARCALQLARELGRDLEAVHVVPHPPFPFAGEMQARPVVAVEASLEPWLERHGLGGASSRQLQGDAAEELLACAIDRRACALVVGSRQLSGFDRVFQSSTGVDLARFAACPVVVVPPAAIVRWSDRV